MIQSTDYRVAQLMELLIRNHIDDKTLTDHVGIRGSNDLLGRIALL
jgi:hypothetical protein